MCQLEMILHVPLHIFGSVPNVACLYQQIDWDANNQRGFSAQLTTGDWIEWLSRVSGNTLCNCMSD